VGLAPLLRTTTTLSSAFDTRGFQSVIAAFHQGAFGDTPSSSVYTEAELQESDDNITYTAVADTDLSFPGALTARTGTATGTFFQSKSTGAVDLAGLYPVGYKGSKRYLKVNVRATGTHTNGEAYGVTFYAGNADYDPAQ
jgi:hypothetical protein